MKGGIQGSSPFRGKQYAVNTRNCSIIKTSMTMNGNLNLGNGNYWNKGENLFFKRVPANPSKETMMSSNFYGLSDNQNQNSVNFSMKYSSAITGSGGFGTSGRKIDSNFQGRTEQTKMFAMQNPSDDVSRSLGSQNQHGKSKKGKDPKMSIDGKGIEEQMFGKPQQDPEEPIIAGSTNFAKKQNFMDK